MRKKQKRIGLAKPRNYYLQVVDEEENIKTYGPMFVSAGAILDKATIHARSPNVLRVLILDGKANPENPHPDLIVDCIENRPEECGKGFFKVAPSEKLIKVRRVGEEEASYHSESMLPPIYAQMGRWYSSRKVEAKG